MSNASQKVQGTTTLNYVVMSVLNRLGDYSMRHYSRLEQIIIECFIDLNIWHLETIEVVYLRMSEAKTVDLPADFVDYTKIGVPVNGKLRVITKNQNILLPRTFEDGEEVGNLGNSPSDTIPEGYINFAPHFRGGQYTAGLYGLPGGIDTSYYRVDLERRTIVFSGAVARGEIVLEYISTGVKINGQTIIPREVIPALRAYAMWWNVEHDKRVSEGRKQRLQNEYDAQVEALRYFQSAFTVDEYKRHMYKYSRQTVKR